jgi:hypothetical protein
MSVTISNSVVDEPNSVELRFGHPLKTLRTQTDDDVVYLTIPYGMLEEILHHVKGNIEIKRDLVGRERDFHILFSRDIKLRHGFVFGK